MAKVALTILMAGLLAACGSMHCQEQSRNSRAAGECGVFSKF